MARFIHRSMRRWTQPTAPSSPASSGNLSHHEEIAGHHPDQCLRASPAKCGRPRRNLSDFPNPPFPDPKPRIPNLGMAYAKHRTSNVSPWEDRTSSVRWGNPGERGMGRKGRKREAGRKGSGTTWCPWTGQLWQRKGPAGRTMRGVAKGEPGYRLPFPARADKSINRKHKAHKARYPRTRKRGFTIQSLQSNGRTPEGYPC
jgi:hypothetical protein